jgi:hypothetical protein
VPSAFLKPQASASATLGLSGRRPMVTCMHAPQHSRQVSTACGSLVSTVQGAWRCRRCGCGGAYQPGLGCAHGCTHSSPP